MGVWLGLLAGVLAASKDLLSKRLSFQLKGAVSALASFVFALPYYIVLLGLLYLLGWEDFAFSAEFMYWVVLRSTTDMLAEWCRMEALARADISFISPMLGLSPVFLLLAAPLINGDQISAWGVIAVLVVVAGSLILITRRKSSTNSESVGRAILLALACSIFFSLNSCFDKEAVKVASPTLSGFGMTAIAALFLVPPAWLAMRKEPGTIAHQFRAARRPLWLRGLFEVLYMVTKLTALQYLPTQYVAALGRSSLLYSVVGGKLFFREEDFLRRLVGAALIAAGVVGIVLLELQT